MNTKIVQLLCKMVICGKNYVERVNQLLLVLLLNEPTKRRASLEIHYNIKDDWLIFNDDSHTNDWLFLYSKDVPSIVKRLWRKWRVLNTFESKQAIHFKLFMDCGEKKISCLVSFHSTNLLLWPITDQPVYFFSLAFSSFSFQRILPWAFRQRRKTMSTNNQ